MDFKRQWTQFALEAEYDHFGTARFVKAHNEQIATLQSQLAASQERETVSMNSDNLCTPHKIFLNSQNLTGCVLCERNKEIEDLKAQLAASQKRERILREGLEAIYDLRAPDYREGYQPFEVGDYEQGVLTGKDDAADIAREYIQKAEEVKG